MNKIQNLITKGLFSAYDVLHGGRIKKYYKEVKNQNRLDNTFRTDKLNDYLASWSLNEDIRDLPIMTKERIRELTSQVNESNISSYVFTGGSTGDPLKVPYSKNRKLIRTARIAYYNEIADFQIGDPYLFIRAKRKSKLLQFLRNELLFIPTDISEESIKKISKKIVDQKISVLIGYPTVIFDIASIFQESKNWKKNHFVKSIITVSEPIDDLKRDFIKDTFNCRLIDRYSNEEVGVIAQQNEFRSDYIVDRFNVFVEILHPETLEPVGENEIGKVVVTDICNDLIPIIRYDTGDFAMVSTYKGDQLFSIKKIIGRSSEQIRATDGTPISSLSLGPYIHQPFSEADLTCQFQFAQVGMKEFQLRIQAPQNDKFTFVCEKITKGLKDILGEDACIEIVFLSNITPLPSGKRPLYRNETIN